MRWKDGGQGHEKHTWQCGVHTKFETRLIDRQPEAQLCRCEGDRLLEVDGSLDIDEVDVPKNPADGFSFQRCADEFLRRHRSQRGVLWVQDSEGINDGKG